MTKERTFLHYVTTTSRKELSQVVIRDINILLYKNPKYNKIFHNREYYNSQLTV